MKKLLSIAILFCGLMLGKLGAEQAYGVKLVVVTGIENKKPLIGKYTYGDALITNGYQPEFYNGETNNYDFVCSGEIVELFSRIVSVHDVFKPRISESDPNYEQIQRKVNKYMRNLRNIGVSYSDYHISYLPYMWGGEYVYYDFMMEFNLFKKMKLSFPKGEKRVNIIDEVMFRLNAVQDGRSFFSGQGGYKVGVDDNTLEDLSYEFRDFMRTKIEELSTLKINRTKRLLENTCAPLEKASKNTGGTDIFDKTKIKHLEDLDPTQVTKFIPEQQRKFIIIQENGINRMY